MKATASKYNKLHLTTAFTWSIIVIIWSLIIYANLKI